LVDFSSPYQREGVQGVGFRPTAFINAPLQNCLMTGLVSYDPDGVHVFFNTDSKTEADDVAQKQSFRLPLHGQ
jgi:hydrogenase maturation factor HypF (carbamoyltransferase family)